MHDLKITAKYEGAQYTKVAELSFTVDVKDPCLYAELTIGPSFISSSSLEYEIYSGEKQETFDLNAITSSEPTDTCPGFSITVQ